MARYSTNYKKEEEKLEALRNLREGVDYCCEGCGKIDPEDKSLCVAYIKPQERWAKGGCFLATHLERKETKRAGKVRVGQQKQKKNK